MSDPTRAPGSPLSLLGLPEGDGFAPFVFVSFGGAEPLVVAGRVGLPEGLVDVEVGHTSAAHAQKIFEGARTEHQLDEVPAHVLLHVVERAVHGSGALPEGWELVRETIDAGLLNTARLVDPLARLDSDLSEGVLERSGVLAHPKHGLFFQLDGEVAESVFDQLYTVLTDTSLAPEAKRAGIAELVAEAADGALGDATRARWMLALDVATLLFSQREEHGLADAARHSSLALQAGRKGSALPWVLAWTERQLAAATERMMALMRGRQ